MNCICDLFDNECFWIILIAVAIIYCSNNHGGCGCGRNYNNCGCGCN